MLNLPSSIKHTHHIVMMKDGMCPFHLWDSLPPLLKAHGSKCIVHDPSTDEMGSDHSLTKRSEPLVLPTDRWLELVGTYVQSDCRSIPMSIPMNDSIVESTLGGMFIVLRTRFHRWSRTKCFLWNRRWKETNSPSLQAISAPTAYVLSFVCFNFLFWIVACVTTIFHPKQSRIVFVSPWSNVLCEDVFVHSSLCPCRDWCILPRVCVGLQRTRKIATKNPLCRRYPHSIWLEGFPKWGEKRDRGKRVSTDTKITSEMILMWTIPWIMTRRYTESITPERRDRLSSVSMEPVPLV